jgi:hypothetical protein
MRSSQEASAAILSPVLEVMGNSVFIAWIERGAGNNRVMFSVFHQDKEKNLPRAVELITTPKPVQFRLFTDSKERLYILETLSQRESQISIHLSVDRGKTFKRIPLAADGEEFLTNPIPVLKNDTLYLFFLSVKEGKMHIGMKSFEMASLKLKESIVLKYTDSVSFMEAFTIIDRPAIIYKTFREAKFALEGFIKEGTLWKYFEIKGAEGLDVARMDYYVWGDGRVLVVFSGEERERFKQRIYAAVSEDGGKSWDVRRIDNKEFDNTRSWLPRMAVDGDKVAVVWEDSRGIRPGVRMKLSPDRGRTWMEKDIPLSGGKNFAFRPRISFAGGGFHVAWHQFRDDEKKVADLTMVKLNWDDAVKRASRKEKGSSLKEKEALLRKRVKAYWEGMMKKDLKTTYMIHDPFYRARIPFDYYASHRGPMVFHSYSIEGVRIEGNEAFVNLKVRYEVPKITILSKETSIPSKEITAEDTYLFIDGTWYRKFVDVLSGGSAIDY